MDKEEERATTVPVLLRSPLGEADPVPESAAATGEFIKKQPPARPTAQPGFDALAPPRARVKNEKEEVRAPA